MSKPFTPHVPNTSIGVIDGMPIVEISQQAYQDMMEIVDQSKLEVGWLGIVKRENNIFIIEEVFLLKQEVSATSTELSEDGISELAMEILAQPDGVDKANRLLFWGHSHVNMPTLPSGQDNTQMSLFRNNGSKWFVRGIANKQGSFKFDVYEYEKGYVVNDVEWRIALSVNRRAEFWAEQIGAKVKEQTIVGYIGGKNYSQIPDIRRQGENSPSYWELYNDERKKRGGKRGKQINKNSKVYQDFLEWKKTHGCGTFTRYIKEHYELDVPASFFDDEEDDVRTLGDSPGTGLPTDDQILLGDY